MKNYNKLRARLNKNYVLSQMGMAKLIGCCILFMSCADTNDGPVVRSEKEEESKEEFQKSPLFNNSIVSTDIDFIKSSDPDAFLSLVYKGQEKKEMPDIRSDDLFDENTYVFEANFKNDEKVEIWVHSAFNSESAAQEYANKVTGPLGKLPSFMRAKIDHLVLHKGDGTNSSEDEGGFIILYSDKIDTRVINNDLEETVFHEAAHVTFDIQYVKTSDTWEQLRTKDNESFITVYAKDKPNREDLPEFALFAYTMTVTPDRLSSEIQDWIKTNMPNRLAFLETIFK